MRQLLPVRSALVDKKQEVSSVFTSLVSYGSTVGLLKRIRPAIAVEGEKLIL